MSGYGSFNWKWFLNSIIIFFIVQFLLSIIFFIFGFFTFGLGFLLFLVIKPAAYYFGGYFTAVLSPGTTIKEPAAGALAVSVLGFLFDAGRVSGGHLIGLIAAGTIAYFCALWGARSGEE